MTALPRQPVKRRTDAAIRRSEFRAPRFRRAAETALPPSTAEKARDGHVPPPGHGGFLAFDVGTRKIGIAHGQRVTGTAQALARLPVQHGLPDWQALDRIVREWRPEALVIGLPRMADGREGTVARLARRLGGGLAERYGLPVHYVDEHLTSVEAAHRLATSELPRRRRERARDAMAAQLILESFLEGRRERAPAG